MEDQEEYDVEVLYENTRYRVEVIVLDDVHKYAIYNSETGVLEANTPIYPQALNSADELELAVNKFFESKEVPPKEPLIAVV